MAPGNVSLIAASPSQLTFSWTPVTHSCSAVNYTLTTSLGCGDCSTTTSSPSATCIIDPLQPTDSEGHTCTVSVQAVVCDNILGEPSAMSTFRLKGKLKHHCGN